MTNTEILSIPFVEGQFSSGSSNSAILLCSDGDLYTIGDENTNGGCCDCCSSGGLPSHVGYFLIPDFIGEAE